MRNETIKIRDEYIKLDSLLKLTGIATTGGHAKIMIADRLIQVNGEVCTMRGKKIRSGDKVQYLDNTFVIE